MTSRRIGRWIGERPVWFGAVAAGTAPVLNLVTDGSSSPIRWVATAGLCLLGLTGFSVPWLRAQNAETEAAQSRAKALTAMADALRPVLGSVATTVTETGAPADGGEAVSRVLMAATQLCSGGDRTRACWFEVQGRGAARRLVPVRHWGRGATPRTSFRVSEPRGRELLALLDADRSELYANLSTSRPEMWQETDGNDVAYAAYLAVPARSAGGHLLGMLTVDSPRAGALTQVELDTARLLADVLVLVLTRSRSPRVASTAAGR